MAQYDCVKLRHLARLCGISTEYWGLLGHKIVSEEALFATLCMMGVLGGVHDLDEAIRRYRLIPWLRRIEPVYVVWDGRSVGIPYRLPKPLASGKLQIRLELENGDVVEASRSLESLPTQRIIELEGCDYLVKLIVPGCTQLDIGYHQLMITHGEFEGRCTIICAPEKCYGDSIIQKRWGVFMPLYALHTQRSWCSGDFTDLQTFSRWVNTQGGAFAATLPLTPTYLETPFDPSPYAPISKIFWNEFYIDPEQTPEFENAVNSGKLESSWHLRQRFEPLRVLKQIDYSKEYALKRQILTAMATSFFQSSISSRREAYDTYLATHPRVMDYAAFRATMDRAASRGVNSWRLWPDRQRHGQLLPEDYSASDYEYYLYTQWIAGEQIDQVAKNARETGLGLYLDLPLGVNSNGYDVWRDRNNFVEGISGGAPPDMFFLKGQCWGFPPMHPTRIREHGHAYWRQCLMHLMRHSGMMRIDHVMGLHRLYWIPDGIEPDEGVYVRYPAEELYAVLSIESHRHQTLVVGEDLGTVPGSIRASFDRHGLYGMDVTQFNVNPDPINAVMAPLKRTVAGFDTHDTATFAGFWLQHDIDDQVELGLIDSIKEDELRRWRMATRYAIVEYLKTHADLEDIDSRSNLPDDMEKVYAAFARLLASGNTAFALYSMEDFWLEARQQNTPGTSTERPNWRGRAAYSFETLSRDPKILELIRVIHDHRNASSPSSSCERGVSHD